MRQDDVAKGGGAALVERRHNAYMAAAREMVDEAVREAVAAVKWPDGAGEADTADGLMDVAAWLAAKLEDGAGMVADEIYRAAHAANGPQMREAWERWPEADMPDGGGASVGLDAAQRGRLWDLADEAYLALYAEVEKRYNGETDWRAFERGVHDALLRQAARTGLVVRAAGYAAYNLAVVTSAADNGIAEYRVRATLDTRTSRQCRELDGDWTAQCLKSARRRRGSIIRRFTPTAEAWWKQSSMGR